MWYLPGIKAFLEKPSSIGLFHCFLLLSLSQLQLHPPPFFQYSFN